MKKITASALAAVWMLQPLAYAQVGDPAQQASAADVQEAQEMSEAPQGASVSSDYRVGVEDVLVINVLRPDKLDATVTVGPDGSISFPHIGSVNVKGKTLTQVQQTIQARLADGYMKYPDVAVFLKEARSKKFYISGEVAKPGAYALDDNTTVLKAVSIAGGFSKFGSYGRGKIMRPKPGGGYQTIPIHIKNIMEGKPGHPNLALKAGDTLMVSEDQFFVYGEVSKPGSYPVEENTTVLKAISVAGGFTKTGSSGRVKVMRPRENGQPEVHHIDIKGMLDQSSPQANMKLEPGDTVVVSEDKFFVYGAVAKPGTYPMEENLTVLKAISIGGGLSKFGSSSKVKILRPKKAGKGYETIKVNVKGIMDGSSEVPDVPLEPGDTVVVSEGFF